MRTLKSTINERIKEWMREDDSEEEKQQNNRMIWMTLL
jgi:hypothetical protein